MIQKKIYLLIITAFTLLQGCGFHLRGSYVIPPCLKRLQITPNQSTDLFQQVLQRVLMSNGVVFDAESTSTLTILHQDFQEQALAYAFDGQLKRARLSLAIDYQLDTKIPGQSIQKQVRVSKELNIDSNNILNTDNERQRLKNDLWAEAATQLVFQLSMQYDSSSKAP